MTELNDFVMSKFQIEVNEKFSYDFIKRNEEKLKVVDASPLEESRYNISINDINKYYESLEKFREEIHPQLLCNIDESSDQQRKITKKRK